MHASRTRRPEPAEPHTMNRSDLPFVPAPAASGLPVTRRQWLAAGSAALLTGAGPWALAQPQAKPATLRFGVSVAGVGHPPRIPTGWMTLAQTLQVIEQELAPD